MVKLNKTVAKMNYWVNGMGRTGYPFVKDKIDSALSVIQSPQINSRWNIDLRID